ncbi:MAG: TonB-dependent receptor [Bryobacteraceae bacterium]
MVEAASLHVQSLQEAPANVTVVTAAQIAKYGYRTLAEALSSVRGFYVTSDHIYDYVGVRGVGLPGDFNTKFLVLINGHNMTEHIFDSNGFFGQDFGLDFDLIERIEIVRGPSSALYGSNGMLATINVVTRSPVEVNKGRIAADAGSFGEKKLTASSSLNLGDGVNLLLSASIFNNAGQDLFFPQFNSPATNNGYANGDDGERGYHTFANLIWQGWNLTGYFNSRQKQTPVAWGPAIFNDAGNNVRDSRNFVNASYSKTLSDTRKLRWQVYYDNYTYHQRFDYALADAVEDSRETALNDWVGTDLTYSFGAGRFGSLTVGSQALYELRNLQHEFVVAPVFENGLTVNRPDRSIAIFAQDELTLTKALKADFGLRLDDSANFGAFLSPRLALVYQRSPGTTFKLIYGRPFRNPSAAEQYYSAPDQILAGPLKQETANMVEVSVERKFRRNFEGIVAAYDYSFQNLITSNPVAGSSAQQYQNSGLARSVGIELELSGKPVPWIEVSTSYSYGAAKDLILQQLLPNSPQHIAKLRFATPLARGRLTLSESTQYLSPRLDQSGASTRSVLLVDMTLTTHQLFRDFDLQFGGHNLLNWHYTDPVALEINQIRADGISFFVRVMWQTGK